MLNIIIPMAGRGSRFVEKGFTFPKPLIEINGKPMIQAVVDNVRPKIPHVFTFICRKDHHDKYSLYDLLNLIAPRCNIITVNAVTEGAACTVLLASEYFHSEDYMMIANSDQYLDFDMSEFINDSIERKLDGNIICFPGSHPKWSYVKLDENKFVVEVAEKRTISNLATAGVYFYRSGKVFFEAATSMIEKDVRVDNEFYVCPAYNEMILQGLKIGIFEIKTGQMYGLGTPEDLDRFEKSPIAGRI